MLGLGLATMLVGGYRALRQNDLKLLLAFGTVSQLGFLMVLVGAGSRELRRRRPGDAVAHALFKSTLFLTVGVIDHATGTRDLRRLSGLGRRLPVLAVVGGLAGAPRWPACRRCSGFVGKEAAFTALLDGGLPDRTAAPLVLAGLVLGSVLTAAYTLRFLWGAFARKPGCGDRAGRARPPARRRCSSPPPPCWPLAGLVAGPASPLLEPLVAGLRRRAAAGRRPRPRSWRSGTGCSRRWRLSALTLLGGAALFAVRAAGVPAPAAARRRRLGRRGLLEHACRAWTASPCWSPAPPSAARCPPTSARSSSSSWRCPGSVLLFRAPWPGEWRAWDTPVQALVGAVVLIAAVLALRIRQRLSAVLVVGVTGYGLAVLFVLQGAPDLALTQFLVETLTLVVFVLVLRKLPKDITERHRPRERAVRGVIAVAVGLLMAVRRARSALSARTATPVSVDYPEAAYDFGGGQNIVNVTLVDIRAWDTLGEISVLVVAATGVASLVFLRRRTGARRPARPGRTWPGDRPPRPARPARQWLAGSAALAPERRSVVLEVVTRMLFHTIVVFSVYLLFSGHNEPGGGFAGGLVAGLALVLRYLAGGRYELGEAAPVDPGLLLGVGLLFAGGTGVVGLAARRARCCRRRSSRPRCRCSATSSW